MSRIIGTEYEPLSDVITLTETYPTLATQYDSLQDLEAALSPSGTTKGLMIEIQNPGGTSSRPFRPQFSLVSAGADDESIDEKIYLVKPTAEGQEGGGNAGYKLELLASVDWTVGAAAAKRASHRHPKAVTVTDSGLSEARSNVGAKAVNQSPAAVGFPDPGNARALVRIFKKPTSGGAVSCRPLVEISA